MNFVRHRWILSYGAAFISAGAVLAAVMMADPVRPFTQGLDEAWLSAMVASRNGVLTAISHLLDLIGGPGSMVLLIAMLAWWIPTRRRWGALFLVAVYVLSTVVAQVVKRLVLRERPADPM